MSEDWVADARVGVPMMQQIAKQISQCKHKPWPVRQIIDQQWLDEESKQQLRETFHVTDADLAAHEREAASETRRQTRNSTASRCRPARSICEAEPVVQSSGRIECQKCGAEWSAAEIRRVIDAAWLDEDVKQQLRDTLHVTDAELALLEKEMADEAPGPRTRAS